MAAPLTRLQPTTRSPVTEGFAQVARLLGAALDGQALSSRTELFRPLPPDPMEWLYATFPTYLQDATGVRVPMAPHHAQIWDWLWSLRPGVALQSLIAILGRGGGKSTTTELGGTVIGYFGLRRYVLYCSDTQTQANDHLGNIGSALEKLGVERAINRYGFSRGWSITRLRTADGFTMDAIGMDTAIRGVRIDEDRPDLIILDDLDDQLDTLDTIQKKVDVLTRKILPTGSAALSIIGVQNMPNTDGIFAQLADGRADFLYDRRVIGPFPVVEDLPEQDWHWTEERPDGARQRRLAPCRAVWAGQPVAACEALLTKIGPAAFAIECLHRGERLGGTVFQRQWFRIVDDWPRGAALVRYWDFAASEEPAASAKGKAADPDWTVGLLMTTWRGQFWVLDVQRVRLSAFGVDSLVAQTAALDGTHVDIWLEEEGGASGKAVTATYRRQVLTGYAVHTWHSTGSKGQRAKPFASAAEAGNVFLVRAPWNGAYLDELHHFGQRGWHDDQVDASAGAHYALTLGQTLLPSDFSIAKAVEGMTQRGVEARAQTAALLPALAALWGMADEPERV